jgi:hypothetical protein
MKSFKKILTYLLIAFITTIFIGLVFLQKIKNDAVLKENSIYWAKKIKNYIYLQATNHNPEGDRFPDQIDDAIIFETKKVLN